MKILIYTFLEEDLAWKLKQHYIQDEIIQTKDRNIALKEVVDSDILILNIKDEEVIENGKKLKLIQTLSSGVDYLPLDLIKSRNIILCNTAGIHSGHMSEYAISSMILLARNLHVAIRNQTKHIWNQQLDQHEIAGSTIGILGLGSIGKELARKANFMGMKVVGIRKHPKKMENVDEVYSIDDIDKLIKQSDYIVNLLPLTKETEKIINKEFFEKMKNTACLINMGRGPTTDQKAMYEALINKTIRGVVSDVFFMEPLEENSLLWDLENLVITPHICGFVSNYMDKAIKVIKPNLDMIHEEKQAELINQVDLKLGY